MVDLTVNDYKKAIGILMHDREKMKVLKKLYHCKNSTASAIDLARKLNYSHFIRVNNQIGKIGKTLAISKKGFDTKSIPFYTIKGIRRPCYFFLVGPYYNEDKEHSREAGWEMRKNLKIALEKLRII